MNQVSNFETFISKSVEYAETSINLLKLKAVDKSSHFTTSIIWRLVVILLTLSAVLFINIGICVWLGDILGKAYFGFFIIGGVYLLTGLFMYLFREKWIKVPLGNFIIKKLLSKDYGN